VPAKKRKKSVCVSEKKQMGVLDGDLLMVGRSAGGRKNWPGYEKKNPISYVTTEGKSSDSTLQGTKYFVYLGEKKRRKGGRKLLKGGTDKKERIAICCCLFYMEEDPRERVA